MRFHGSTEMGATSTGSQARRTSTSRNAAVKAPPGEPVILTTSCNRFVQSPAQKIGSLKFLTNINPTNNSHASLWGEFE